MNCQQVREEVAIALLMREPLEAAAAQHLESCAACSAEAAALAPVSQLLAVAEPPAELAEHHPSPAALDRLLTEAARRRTRRTGRWLAAVAAALVVAVPVGVAVAHRTTTSPPATASPSTIERSATDAATGVSAQVKLWPEDWGSGLRVSIDGVKPGTECTLSVVRKDGTRQTAATWWATYRGSASVDGSVAAAVSDIARLEVLDDSGRVLVPVQLG